MGKPSDRRGVCERTRGVGSLILACAIRKRRFLGLSGLDHSDCHTFLRASPTVLEVFGGRGTSSCCSKVARVC